jgi:hypothetical protein
MSAARVALLAFFLVLLPQRHARAGTPPGFSPDTTAPPFADTEPEFAPTATRDVWVPKLASASGWSAGADAYAGFANASFADTRGAFAIGGAQVRLRYRYVELGSNYERTDETGDHTFRNGFRSWGGFAGAVLPFFHWIDVDLLGGFGWRTYFDNDPRYGANGYELGGPTASLRAGISDRSSLGLFGLRVGAQFACAYDLESRRRHWEQIVQQLAGPPLITRGVTRVGGLTTGLIITLGFEFGAAKTSGRL